MNGRWWSGDNWHDVIVELKNLGYKWEEMSLYNFLNTYNFLSDVLRKLYKVEYCIS